MAPCLPVQASVAGLWRCSDAVLLCRTEMALTLKNSEDEILSVTIKMKALKQHFVHLFDSRVSKIGIWDCNLQACATLSLVVTPRNVLS